MRSVHESGRDGWPARGVYFFFEEGERRDDGVYSASSLSALLRRVVTKSTTLARCASLRGI